MIPAGTRPWQQWKWEGNNICHEFTKALCPFHSENPKEESLLSSGSCIRRPLSFALSCELSGDSIPFSRKREKKKKKVSFLIPLNESHCQHACLMDLLHLEGACLMDLEDTQPRGWRFSCENASPVKHEGYMTELWSGCIIIDWTMKLKRHLRECCKVMHFLKGQRMYSWARDHSSDTYG